MPYPHDMGHAEKIWDHEMFFSDIGKIIVMGAIEKVSPDFKLGKEQWIASVTFSVYVLEQGGTHGGSSGYLYSEWKDSKEDAITAVMEHKHYQTKMSY